MAMSGMIRFSNVVIVKSLSMVKPQHSHWIFFFSCVKSMFVLTFFMYRINSTSTIIPVVKHSFFGHCQPPENQINIYDTVYFLKMGMCTCTRASDNGQLDMQNFLIRTTSVLSCICLVH